MGTAGPANMDVDKLPMCITRGADIHRREVLPVDVGIPRVCRLPDPHMRAVNGR